MINVDSLSLEQLVANYTPSQETIYLAGNVTLIMTLGSSGAGKTTIMRASGLPLVLSDASRAPRAGEHDGVDYWFHSEAEMLQDAQKGEYVQLAMGSGGGLKGTKTHSFPAYGEETFAVVASAIPTFRKLPFKRTYAAVIVPPTSEAWMDRIALHDLKDAELQLRLSEARQSLAFALQDDEAQFVLNDETPQAALSLRQVAAGEVPGQAAAARSAARQLLEGIVSSVV